MNRQGEVSQKKDSQDGHNNDQAQVKPYLGTDKEAQNLAKLGTLALVGNYESHQQMLAEIHRLEQDPQHFKAVAQDLAKINVTADGLPVHAKVETDASGNIVGLKFDSSKDLEKIVYGNEAKYAQCIAENGVRPAVAVSDMNAIKREGLLIDGKLDEADALRKSGNDATEAIMNRARETCKPLDVPASTPQPIPPSHEFTVLNSAEQKTLAALGKAIQSGDEGAMKAVVQPFMGQNYREFLKIAGTENPTAPYMYSIDGDKMYEMYYSKPGGGFMKFKSGGS